MLEKVTPVGSSQSHCFWGNIFIKYLYLSLRDLRELLWGSCHSYSVERDALFTLFN
jgi:hypothetical protein